MQCRFVNTQALHFVFLSHSYALYALPGTVHTQNKTGIFNAFLLLHMGVLLFPTSLRLSVHPFSPEREIIDFLPLSGR